MRLGFLPPATRGFDCNQPVSRDAAMRMRAVGYLFAVRYVGRMTRAPHDLSSGELLTLLECGLGAMIVQHVANPGWRPTHDLGLTYGENAVRQAREVGALAGSTLWLDLEGVHATSTAYDVLAYCNIWHEVVLSGGFEPGIYLGDANGLTAIQAYRSLRFVRYWAAYNLNRDKYPIVRGVCLRQRPYPPPALRVAGVPFEYDENILGVDALGGTPTLMLPACP